MEYDHLNYTPPANTWKPHYQRMNNGIVGLTPDAAGPTPTPTLGAVPTPTPTGPVPTATPPIPPLPKLHVPPGPGSELEPLAVPPIPPLRDDPPADDSPTPWRHLHATSRDVIPTATTTRPHAVKLFRNRDVIIC